MMKKFTYSCPFIVLLLVSFTTNAQIGSGYWSFSNPKPFGFTCYANSYTDDNNGIVVGTAGGIAKTTDGGGTWSYFAYTCPGPLGDVLKPTFNDLQMINGSLGFAVGSQGVMIKTTDGGTSWNLLTTPFYSTSTEIHTVCFLDANTGYIAGEPDINTGLTAIYKTINGGSTWVQETGLPSEGRTVLKIRFSPNGVGYATGTANMNYDSSLVWKYAGGVWSDYSITSSIVFPNVNAIDSFIMPHSWDDLIDTFATTYNDNTFGLSQQSYRAIAIISDTEVVIGAQNNGALLRINTSTPAGSYLMLNNGSSFHPRYHTLESFQCYTLLCKDGSEVVGAVSQGRLLQSQDKGFTWASTPIYDDASTEGGLDLRAVDITPGKRYVVAGDNGLIADSITQWRKPYKTAKKSGGFGANGISTIAFADANNGIVGGASGLMLRTVNGGDTWEDISNTSFNPWDAYTAVSYVSPTVLYAAASNGMLYKSVDKGNIFDLYFTEPVNGNLAAMDFANEDTGWIAANTMYTNEIDWTTTFHQIIYRTTDGGLTWDSSNTVFPTTPYSEATYLYGLKFLNASVGYTVGTLGSIYKTTDGGLTWNRQLNVPPTLQTLHSVSVVDANVAYVAGDSGIVWKTTNGGAEWVTCNNGLPSLYTNYYKVLMYDAGQGLVFTRGTVYTTKDGGDSWTPYYAPVDDAFLDACFAPIDGCTLGVCRKVYAGTMMSGQIMKFDSDKVIPVKFSNLTAAATTQGNQLFWTAFSQQMVNYFEVQGSTDGLHFETVSGKVQPSGLNYESHKWLHTDAPSGKYYYRVKAIERSGAIYYTNIVLVNNRKASGWSHQLMNSNLLLNNINVNKGNVNVQVINAGGQLVAAKNWKQSGGAFNEMITLPPAAQGVYYVRLTNEGAVYNFSILVR